ncbi:MAG: hypothetical protein R3Y61_03685 [Rikenellaceae bacterium]
MVQFFLELSMLSKVIYILLIFTFFYQLFQWLGFSAIAAFKQHRYKDSGEELPSVSVVIVVEESSKSYLEREIEKILIQKYEGDWEVVVVNDCGGLEITDELEMLQQRYSNLRFTEIRKDVKFSHSRKFPLSLGIKAARFENIVVADPSASPTSKLWLKQMASGFRGGKIVVGYTGFRSGTSGFIRSSRLMSSIRWLSAAIADRPYRGIFNNLGYNREAFFQSNFTHLRLATGEDDLFIQKLETMFNCNVVISPRSTMRQYAYGGLRWWWAEQRYRNYGMKFYPFSVRFKILMELVVKVLFFASVSYVALDSLLWGGAQWAWVAAAGVFVLREFIVWWAARRIMRRLGEKKMLFAFMVYDIINPFTEAALRLSLKLKKPSTVWK